MLGLSGNSGSQGLSEDEALFWIWWCLETLLADEKGEDMDEGLLFTFTEVRFFLLPPFKSLKVMRRSE